MERWTPSFGQLFVEVKVESGFMIQAAWGWQEAGRAEGGHVGEGQNDHSSQDDPGSPKTPGGVVA